MLHYDTMRWQYSPIPIVWMDSQHRSLVTWKRPNMKLPEYSQRPEGVPQLFSLQRLTYSVANFTEFYLKDIENKVCSPTAQPRILKESAATAWVDGCNALGPVVGTFCMDLAIKKAKEAGVAVVTAKGITRYFLGMTIYLPC